MTPYPISSIVGTNLDPRPDLVDDASLWSVVLDVAQHTEPDIAAEKSVAEESTSVFGLLHGLRCGGAKLIITHSGTLRLDYSALVASGSWTSHQLRTTWLLPAVNAIKQIFSTVEQKLALVEQHNTHYQQEPTYPTVVGL